MSITKKDEEDWEKGRKEWLEACKEVMDEIDPFHLRKECKKIKSGQEIQQEQCKGKTIMEMLGYGKS